MICKDGFAQLVPRHAGVAPDHIAKLVANVCNLWVPALQGLPSGSPLSEINIAVVLLELTKKPDEEDLGIR